VILVNGQLGFAPGRLDAIAVFEPVVADRSYTASRRAFGHGVRNVAGIAEPRAAPVGGIVRWYASGPAELAAALAKPAGFHQHIARRVQKRRSRPRLREVRQAALMQEH
jgi:hypothetical protein